MLPPQGAASRPSRLISGPPSPHLPYYLPAETSGESACCGCSRATSNVGTGDFLIRAGVGMTAAAAAVFAIGFIYAVRLPPDTGLANVETRADAGPSGPGSIHPKTVNLDTAAIAADGQESSQESPRAQVAGLRTQDDFEFA